MPPAGLPGCGQSPRRRDWFTNRAPDANNVATDTGVDEVNPVSYLPAAFTTLFFLAASLLLGLIR
jgi:hypothetical protein